jgi:hypothetical protein
MDTSNILALLRAERNRINQAIAAVESLDGTAATVNTSTKAAKTTHPNATATAAKRTISPAGRKHIAEAQKARWAAKKTAAKRVATANQAAPKKAKRVVSPESRKRMAEAQQKRWAKKKRAAKAAAKKASVASVPTTTKTVAEALKA